jgi:BirA family transcriptional regulator, biotin operon repressor / biotin---[acetyl-CoA-carboxylase] ligase
MQLVGSNIVHLDETGSTNDYAIGLLKSSHPVEGTVITTRNQISGHGLENNSWESEPGKNLTMSLILYPKFLQPEKQSLLLMAISLGVYDLVHAKINSQPVTIKWPNDIYISERKVCGMLIQNSVTGDSFDYAVAGIGLNVNQDRFIGDAPNPVSMKMVAGKEFPPFELMMQLCKWLDSRYVQLRMGDHKGISEEYLSLMYRLNEWHIFEIRGRPTEARITGISRYGQLQLDERNGMRSECDIKEVKFLI